MTRTTKAHTDLKASPIFFFIFFLSLRLFRSWFSGSVSGSNLYVADDLS